MINATMGRRMAFALTLCAILWPQRVEPAPQAPVSPTLTLPLKEGSLRFAVLGDTGTGGRQQYELARQLAAVHLEFPFEFVIMVGDNIIGADTPGDMAKKFSIPYKALLDKGIPFRAVLGNHDSPTQRFYKPFNMAGERYYTFRAAQVGAFEPKGGGVHFFALETDYLDKPQIEWLEKELQSSKSEWKIAFFHHPLYSSGKAHGSSLETRAILEPLFVKYGLSAAFSGHDHVYERIKPQKGGIGYWVSGAGGRLRKGDLRVPSPLTAKGFDRDCHFMIVEISGDDLYYQAISRTGTTVDSGVFHRPGALAVDHATPAAVAPSPALQPR
jgi:3',5'-cyclic AMP phosphodiesterase CpdA